MTDFSIPDFTANPAKYVKTKTTSEIIEFLKLANEHYRNNSDTLISDDLYDWLEEYAKKKDPTNVFFTKIGAPVQNKTELPEWMGSLDKIRDDPKALANWTKKYNAPYILSEKLDGNSGMFSISKKKKLGLYTRGDGLFGRDISSYIKYFNKDISTIETIFAKTEINLKKDYPLLVRGELVLSKKSWDSIKKDGSNARNIIAGTLNAKTPDENIAKHIDFVAYELIEPKLPFNEGLKFMKSLGFNVVYHKQINVSEITNDTLSKYLLQRRKESSYEIDGIVIRDNEIHKIIKEKNPKYAFAYKTMLTHESVDVIVLKVEWNVSKDGLIKPIVQFAPITINNVKIKQATGFNGAFIEKHCIGVGSKITIIRSGDVIPHITAVLTKATSGNPLMPDIPYEWSDTHIDIMIKKDEENEQMQLKQMVHFAKKMEITHVGEGVLKKLFNSGIDTIPKLLSIKKSDLLKIDGIREKGAEKIYESIKSRIQNTDCLNLMIASNIFGKGFGERKLKLFVDAHPEILEGKKISVLKKIEGVGEITGTQFLKHLPEFYEFLKEIGYVCKKPEVESSSLDSSDSDEMVFNDMTIVFTGFRNKEWENRIVKLGGKIGSAISKNTALLVVADKDDTSSKIIKAKELGITILDKNTFVKTYKNNNFI